MNSIPGIRSIPSNKLSGPQKLTFGKPQIHTVKGANSNEEKKDQTKTAGLTTGLLGKVGVTAAVVLGIAAVGWRLAPVKTEKRLLPLAKDAANNTWKWFAGGAVVLVGGSVGVIRALMSKKIESKASKKSEADLITELHQAIKAHIPAKEAFDAHNEGKAAWTDYSDKHKKYSQKKAKLKEHLETDKSAYSEVIINDEQVAAVKAYYPFNPSYKESDRFLMERHNWTSEEKETKEAELLKLQSEAAATARKIKVDYAKTLQDLQAAKEALKQKTGDEVGDALKKAVSEAKAERDKAIDERKNARNALIALKQEHIALHQAWQAALQAQQPTFNDLVVQLSNHWYLSGSVVDFIQEYNIINDLLEKFAFDQVTLTEAKKPLEKIINRVKDAVPDLFSPTSPATILLQQTEETEKRQKASCQKLQELKAAIQKAGIKINGKVENVDLREFENQVNTKGTAVDEAEEKYTEMQEAQEAFEKLDFEPKKKDVTTGDDPEEDLNEGLEVNQQNDPAKGTSPWQPTDKTKGPIEQPDARLPKTNSGTVTPKNG